MKLHDVYQRNAARFDRERDQRLFERGWLERFCALLPQGGRVLDLGCGTGRPIAEYLIRQGFEVTGVDFSAAMLEIARDRFPRQRWIEGDLRDFDLNETFDGVLGWNSFFHLTADEQRQVIARMARHLRSGGPLMMTVGPQAGEVWGKVGNDPVYHASLSPKEYRARLSEAGLDVVGFVPNDPDCTGHSVLLAKKG